MTQQDKAQLFKAVHTNPFLLPNAWDVASARIFETEKFAAIGTTSAGIAFSLGYADGQRIPATEMIMAIRRIANSVEAPVTADIEAGYGDPVTIARQVWEAGAVGINLEDVTGEEERTQIRLEQQTEVIRRVRDAVPELFINARTDIFMMNVGDEQSKLEKTIDRLQAYQKAGASGAFAPGVKNSQTIRKIAGALEIPLNVLAAPGSPSLSELRELGVKRVSVGSGPMRACLGLITRMAQEFKNSGTYQTMIDGQYPYSEANRLFARPL
jgi:2-methylisocitrate lyase-like PEP mutase family enzyme